MNNIQQIKLDYYKRFQFQSRSLLSMIQFQLKKVEGEKSKEGFVDTGGKAAELENILKIHAYDIMSMIAVLQGAIEDIEKTDIAEVADA